MPFFAEIRGFNSPVIRFVIFNHAVSETLRAGKISGAHVNQVLALVQPIHRESSPVGDYRIKLASLLLFPMDSLGY